MCFLACLVPFAPRLRSSNKGQLKQDAWVPSSGVDIGISRSRNLAGCDRWRMSGKPFQKREHQSRNQRGASMGHWDIGAFQFERRPCRDAIQRPNKL